MKDVILTIDTEGPSGTDPIKNQIWGEVDGMGFFGIPKIVELCDGYGAKGLFFVDIPEIWDYGYEKIKKVILYIKEHGHDVGVHIHPHHMPNENRQFLFEFTKDEQREIIRKCTDKFVEITGEMPKSFRAGKYGANRDTLDIISEMGYCYDFSDFYSQKWCGIKPHLSYVLPVKYKALIEFPVTIFRSLNLGKLYKRYDKLEATIFPSELHHIMCRYANSETDGVIILFLHSFSLINWRYTPDNPTPNYRNINRFKKSLAFISSNSLLRWISEDDLSNYKTTRIDHIDNVVETQGLFHQLLYTYIRAFSIRKENRMARFLICGTCILISLMIIIFCVLTL